MQARTNFNIRNLMKSFFTKLKVFFIFLFKCDSNCWTLVFKNNDSDEFEDIYTVLSSTQQTETISGHEEYFDMIQSLFKDADQEYVNRLRSEEVNKFVGMSTD